MLFLRCMFNNSQDVIDLRKNTVVKNQRRSVFVGRDNSQVLEGFELHSRDNVIKSS